MRFLKRFGASPPTTALPKKLTRPRPKRCERRHTSRSLHLVCPPNSALSASVSQDLTSLSLEQLASIEITSVSGRAEQLSDAPASVYVITNDDISSSSSRTTDTLYNTPDSSSSDNAKATGDDKKKSDAAADAQDKLDKSWKQKFAAQKNSIAALEKELADLQRDVQSRASNFYGDAGTRLRNGAKYAEDDRKSRDTIAAKQKQLDEAKARLEQMKEEARKAGASPGAIG